MRKREGLNENGGTISYDVKNTPLVKKHGIYEQEAVDLNIENMERNGFTVFKNLIPKTITQKIKSDMYECYQKQINEVGGLDNLKKLETKGLLEPYFATMIPFAQKS